MSITPAGKHPVEAFRLELLKPRYWPVWLGMGLLRLLIMLPYRGQLVVGTGLGLFLRKVLRSRERIARRNLDLCFPQRSSGERDAILKGCFHSLGIMIFETGLAWWGSLRRLRRLCHISGLEHLDQARREGQGVLLLAAHFTTLEMGGRLLCTHHPDSKAGLYREHGNPALQHAVLRARSYAGAMFSRQQTRAAVRHLRQAGLLWYAPDQDYERGRSLFVPFFGISAATSTSVHQLARMGRARVLMLRQRRLPNGQGYRLEVMAPFVGLPSADPAEDCRRINEALEAAVLECPQQYLWIHRRFKNRPPGEASLYD